jgi:putative endonuclease
MNFYVYAIKNPVDNIYIGQTENLQKRIDRHNKKLPSKASSYTNIKAGQWTLFYKQGYKTREEAKEREKQLKSFRGREFLRSILK